jgi:antitoxin component YwqK of YwqJK toxin-antitoxin module
MKNTLFILLSLIMIVSCSNPEVLTNNETSALSNPEVVTNDETSAFGKTVEEMPEIGIEDGLYYEYSSTNIANGTYNAYWGNGQLRATGTYKDGIKEGTGDVYLQNGQLFLRATYKYGELDGFYFRYGSDGTLKSKCFWVNGAKIYCE